MKEDILSKLADILSREILSETETLYSLVQMRKLLERSATKRENEKKFPTLLFYCDWAVHAKLERNSAKKVLQYLGANWRSEESKNFIGFGSFREELRTFLKDFNLPTYVVSNGDCWFEFRHNLIQILIDTPLENPSVRENNQIVKFSLKKGYIDYLLSYRAEFVNGEKEEWNILLADFGPKRETILHEERVHFFKRFADKIRYRQLVAERKNETGSDASENVGNN